MDFNSFVIRPVEGENVFTNFPHSHKTLVKYTPPVDYEAYSGPKAKSESTLKQERKYMGAMFSGVHFRYKNTKHCSEAEQDIDDEAPAMKLLRHVFPPVVWLVKGSSRKYAQWVSTLPCTARGVADLCAEFGQNVIDRNVIHTYPTEKTRELYDELFDELLRQVIISNATLGYLLYLVRKDFRDSVVYYEKLMKSAIAFGQEKVLLDEEDYLCMTEEGRLRREIFKLKITEDDIIFNQYHRMRRMRNERAQKYREHQHKIIRVLDRRRRLKIGILKEIDLDTKEIRAMQLKLATTEEISYNTSGIM